jgi:hypothetical protein
LGICAFVLAVGVEHRVMALVVFAAICGTGAGVIGRALRRRLDREVFASFAEELRKDRQCIPHP